jgi:hypothetical protein
VSSGGLIQIDKAVDPYVRIKNRVLCDQRLSYRARGILAYLLSKPVGWEIRVNDVVARGTEGREAVRAAFRELSECGYAKLIPTAQGNRWKITDKEATVQEATAQKARSGKSTRGFPVALVTTDSQTTESINKRESTNGELLEVPRSKRHPTSAEVEDYAQSRGSPRSDGTFMWEKWESDGWPKNWKNKFNQYQLGKWLPSLKQAASNKPKKPYQPVYD